MTYWGKRDAQADYLHDEPGGIGTWGPAGTLACHGCGYAVHLSQPACPKCEHRTLTRANPEACLLCALEESIEQAKKEKAK